jgi:hypothetical protein
MVLYWMISRTLKNATSEIFGFGSSSEDRLKVAAVPAIPSGFWAHLTDQARRNDDSEPRREFTPWLFPYLYVPRFRNPNTFPNSKPKIRLQSETSTDYAPDHQTRILRCAACEKCTSGFWGQIIRSWTSSLIGREGVRTPSLPTRLKFFSPRISRIRRFSVHFCHCMPLREKWRML